MPSADPLKILFVTPECAPWAKTGGLGDVSAALPQALGRLGHDVRVLMPAYRSLRPLLAQGHQRVAWPADGPWPAAELVAVDAGGLSLWLLDCPGFYDRDGSPYGDPAGLDFEDGLRRFAFLSQVAARLAAGATGPGPIGWTADVLHANDWPTGLAPAYLTERPGRRTASVFTIHNFAFQGLFPLARAAAIGLNPAWLTIDGVLHWDQVSLLKAGVRYADAVTTVSPTYAREIQAPETGLGLDGLMRARAADLHGILNGIDTTAWNPATDPLLAHHYDAATLTAKALNKRALQEKAGLVDAPGNLLFGMVSRLTEQKGVDLVLEVLDGVVAAGHQLVVLGKGDAGFEDALRAAQARHPTHVAAMIGFDEGVAHLIEAGADAFLMPSRFEPCGLNQMYSQAYGTPPIVRATGGLADSVTDASDVDGTGFLFAEASAGSLWDAITRAAAVHADAAAWTALQTRGMSRSFGWETSAARYEAVYRERLAALS